MITTVVIDSGINKELVECSTIDILNKGCYDNCGHGTACAITIKNVCKEVEIISIPLLDEHGMANSMEFEEALQSCLSINCDIINLSLSILDENAGRIKEICCKLREQGKAIISSVTNRLEESIPAIYKDVIGVRGKLFDSPDIYWFNEKRKIQMIADITPVFTDYSLGRYLIFSGNSKATAVASGLLARFMMENRRENIDTILRKNAAKSEWKNSDLVFNRSDLKKRMLVDEQQDIIISLVEMINNLTEIDMREIGRDEELLSLGIITPFTIKRIMSDINRVFGLDMNLKNTTPQDFLTINNLLLAIRRVGNDRTN
nr:S8 family serine peptidase [uncultured Lachnoclostridium sp.]